MKRAAILLSLSFLLTNCGQTGFRSGAARISEDPSKSDFQVTGPDGVVRASIKDSVEAAAANEKLYFNNSGNPTGAPRWQSKTVNWYYNTTNQPGNFTADQVIAKIEESMATWQSICGIKWTFKGTTLTSADSHGDGSVVFGWNSSIAPAAGITYVYWNYVAGMVDADVVLNPTNVNDPTTLEGVLNHEIGHQLGLNHSDVSESIMFANPYHTIDYLLTLRKDDIDGCVGLYGAPAETTAPATAEAPPPSTPTEPVVRLPTSSPPSPTSPTKDPWSYWRTRFPRTY